MTCAVKIAAELSDRRLYREQWESAAKEMDPATWAVEGHALCESVVYDADVLEAVRNAWAGTGPEDGKLPATYNKTAGEIARKRVLTAGLRLGAMLKERSED